MARINLDIPKYDQSTFIGRFKHFASITDFRLGFSGEQQLDNAKQLLLSYKQGKEPKETTTEQVYNAQKLYMSAFHPDTGDKMNVIGRMSFQVPGGMAITGFMMQFYRTIPAVIFWQWVNQSFNALVNYTNRNAASPITNKQIGKAYFTATSSAVITAIGLNSLVKKAPPLVARFVPFAAVASANCVNIPLMRQQELINGITIYDENGQELGTSKKAAVKAISQVVVSRITMAAPGMMLCPVIMEQLEKYKWMQKIKILHAPIQVMMVGCFLIFMVPVACAVYPQKCSMKVSKLEPELQSSIAKQRQGVIQRVYFNKGL